MMFEPETQKKLMYLGLTTLISCIVIFFRVRPALKAFYESADEEASAATQAVEIKKQPLVAISNQYYSISLPGGFTPEDKSAGNRTKIGYVYSDSLSIWILAHPMDKAWEPAKEMREKAEGINRGAAAAPVPMKCTSQQLVQIGGGDGYQLEIEGTEPGDYLRSTAIALVANEIAASIAISCEGKNNRLLYEHIVACARDTFTFTSTPPDAGEKTSRPAAAKQAAPPAELTAEDWAQARQTLKLQGVMQQGGRRAVLINNTIFGDGDYITANWKGRELRFRISIAGEYNEDVSFEPAP